MLDQIVSELYQNFLQKKSSCELISRSKWRWKRAVNNRADNFVSASSGYGSDCCPPVVDPLTFIALLAFIAAAAYFLQGMENYYEICFLDLLKNVFVLTFIKKLPFFDIV